MCFGRFEDMDGSSLVIFNYKTFGPSSCHWSWQVSTTTSADFCEREASYPDRPVFQASLTHGYADRSPQIRACTVPAQAPHLPAPRFRISFALSSTLAWSRRPRMRFLFVTWQVLARMRRSGIIDRLTSTFAGFLPTVGHPSAVAFASCLFLTSYSSGMMPLKEVSELNTGDWSSSDGTP